MKLYKLHRLRNLLDRLNKKRIDNKIIITFKLMTSNSVPNLFKTINENIDTPK